MADNVYVGVEFDEENADSRGVALVHVSWLTPRKKEVWWPPYKQQAVFDKAVKRGELPDVETWMLYKILRSFFEEENYQKALQKLKQTQFVSDIQSEDEQPLKKRKIVPPKRLFESSDSDENEHPLKVQAPPKVKEIDSLLEKSRSAQKKCVSIFDQLKSTSTHTLQRLSVSNDICNLTPSTSTSVATNEEDRDFNKKLLSILVHIKQQNNEILKLLNAKKTSTPNFPLDLPDDIPADLPTSRFEDIKNIEEYLFGFQKWKEVFCRPNKSTKSNITGCAESPSTIEAEVDGVIKVWLKHSPKRLLNEKRRHQKH